VIRALNKSREEEEERKKKMKNKKERKKACDKNKRVAGAFIG
jgi:hypothetical protein